MRKSSVGDQGGGTDGRIARFRTLGQRQKSGDLDAAGVDGNVELAGCFFWGPRTFVKYASVRKEDRREHRAVENFGHQTL